MSISKCSECPIVCCGDRRADTVDLSSTHRKRCMETWEKLEGFFGVQANDDFRVIPTKEINEAKELIENALNPQVTFSENIDDMRESARAVTRTNLLLIQGIINKYAD